jgi:hypothetical protein
MIFEDVSLTKVIHFYVIKNMNTLYIKVINQNKI